MGKAAIEAESLLEDFGLTDIPINLSDFRQAISSDSYPITLEKKPMMTDGFHGISFGDENGAGILINSRISNEHRKRFTLAHELGHVCCHIINNNTSTNFKCMNNDIYSDGESNKIYEKEADEFASSLLMPSLVISEQIISSDLSWQLIQEINNLCDVSLEAAARRTIALSKDACCLIIHKDGKMWYPLKSRSFSTFIPLQSFPISLDSHSNGEAGGSLPDCVEKCDFSDWSFPDNAYGELFYSSIYNTNFNRRMTLLIHDEEYAEDEDNLPEPHF